MKVIHCLNQLSGSALSTSVEVRAFPSSLSDRSAPLIVAIGHDGQFFQNRSGLSSLTQIAHYGLDFRDS